MKTKNNINNAIVQLVFNCIKKRYWGICLMGLILFSCESILDIDPPKDTLITETVFEDVSTVESALANIYYNMREGGMVSGVNGIAVNLGAYSDELNYHGYNTGQLNFYNHNILASESILLDWWNQAYNLIYAANDIIYGLDHSDILTEEDQNFYKAQALFLRGYLHSLLSGVFGATPYIKTIDYVQNNRKERSPEAEVYEMAIEDLETSLELFENSSLSLGNIYPTKSASRALLARLYLYTGSWEMAVKTSSLLIDDFELESDLSKVFLKESVETIWQLKSGKIKNTYEGISFIINTIPTRGYALSSDLLNAFESNDLRAVNWIGSITSDDGLTTLYFANKYKETFTNSTTELEYSIIFRLSEQYLIRAEALAQLNNLEQANQDLNTIRNRAGLMSVDLNSKADLMEAIFKERRIELFTEHAQRWFDLKRFGKASDLLSDIKQGWRDTDVLLPIPESEIELNPNLKPQNPGY
ncbi:RagB/SusD family nutrient uptake outer membrane protein [Aestuariibaculum sediminum]|uniref:RagB/SusD family nutrient uptake outer membrane protein n=1 Tax=Aestuariibaculum sediminum TaxID=2770637 RepID=A0A8J6Q204_9FLAO|nr:RagB/SusD family nutrient uptake outer membrane protein [Aestuariibaculum sediminum]MBD0831506.1 RagB/SusD family nutrient uptake outer membrane protein [Aestuariibaculum sediminum]